MGATWAQIGPQKVSRALPWPKDLRNLPRSTRRHQANGMWQEEKGKCQSKGFVWVSSPDLKVSPTPPQIPEMCTTSPTVARKRAREIDQNQTPVNWVYHSLKVLLSYYLFWLFTFDILDADGTQRRSSTEEAKASLLVAAALFAAEHDLAGPPSPGLRNSEQKSSHDKGGEIKCTDNIGVTSKVIIKEVASSNIYGVGQCR